MQPRSCQEGARSRESACLQCAFTPLAGEPEDDKDGQEAWFTARIASPHRMDRRLTGLAGPEYHATISIGLPFEPQDSQYGKSRIIGA